MTLYAIQATYCHTTSDGYTGTRQMPTFYLDSRVQGITGVKHAEKVARDILTTAVREIPVNDTLFVTAVKV